MQELIVALAVGLASWFVLKRYLPAGLKRIIRTRCARFATRMKWHGLKSWLEREAEQGGNCGSGCGSCGSCGTPNVKPNGLASEDSNSNVPKARVIPIRKLG